MNAIVPALSILLAVLSTSLPLGLPADATFILPFLMVTMVFVWRALRAELPAYAAMLFGLLADVTTGGPLGYWGLMALLAASAGGLARHRLRRRQPADPTGRPTSAFRSKRRPDLLQRAVRPAAGTYGAVRDGALRHAADRRWP